jgi:hypothetical protein
MSILTHVHRALAPQHPRILAGPGSTLEMVAKIRPHKLKLHVLYLEHLSRLLHVVDLASGRRCRRGKGVFFAVKAALFPA